MSQDLGKGNDILVFMPPGARRMEKFQATSAANEIRDEDHAGDGEVVIVGKGSTACPFLSRTIAMYRPWIDQLALFKNE